MVENRILRQISGSEMNENGRGECFATNNFKSVPFV